MNYKSEIDFFIRILKSFNLPTHTVEYPFDDVPDMDLGIRRLLDPTKEYRFYLDIDPILYPGNKLYYALDEYGCHYIFMLLPDSETTTYLFIGPFLTKPFDLYHSLCRFSVVENEDKYLLLATFHHIIFDALSENVFKIDKTKNQKNKKEIKK